MIRNLLCLSVSAVILSSYTTDVEACSTCGQARNYGSYVVGETNTATNEVRSATEAIRVGFDMVITALRASSENITTELHKGAMVNKTMMDEYNRQEEQRARAAYTVASRQMYEDKYGEENIPMTACEDWIQTNSLQVAKEVTEVELNQAIDSFFSEYREASPVDDWRYHERTLQFAAAGDVDLNKSVFTNEDVQNAVEYINQTIDPVPVSPIKPELEIATLSADDRALRSQTQSLNLRLDASKNALKDQVLFKAPIVGEDESFQSILEKRAFEALDPEKLIDLGTGSEMRTLRTLARDLQYGNVMEYQALKSNLAQTRMMAIQLAANSDEYRNGYRYLEKQLDVKKSLQ